VHVGTVYRWKAEKPEFREALQLGREHADQRVEDSMYHRAVGYSFDAVKVVQDSGRPTLMTCREHVPPDVSAGKFWLTNRKGADWKSDAASNVQNNNIVVADVDRMQLARWIADKLTTATEKPKVIESDDGPSD
jgi:hypothetical protein